jgi:hypothetical protein
LRTPEPVPARIVPGDPGVSNNVKGPGSEDYSAGRGNNA